MTRAFRTDFFHPKIAKLVSIRQNLLNDGALRGWRKRRQGIRVDAGKQVREAALDLALFSLVLEKGSGQART